MIQMYGFIIIIGFLFSYFAKFSYWWSPLELHDKFERKKKAHTHTHTHTHECIPFQFFEVQNLLKTSHKKKIKKYHPMKLL
jgi:uncharacterized iron-regulated protein